MYVVAYPDVSVLVISGTGTGVGKTIVTAAIAALAQDQGRRVAVLKPVQTGLADGQPGDLADVGRLAGEITTVELARYPDPLAPETAARRAGRRASESLFPSWTYLCPPRNDHLIAAHVYNVLLERVRRRPGNHASVQIVGSVVAGAPDLLRRIAVLHRTVQVRAYG